MWSDVSPPSTTQIGDAFGVEVGELRAHPGGFEADAFTDGRWFVKLWRQRPDSDAGLALTAELAARGIPVPAAQRALDGSYTAEHQGRRYALFPFVEGRQATWSDAEAIARAMRAVHEITGLALPRTDMYEWCIEALRDRRDHPWIVDRRDEVMANVDRLEAVIERARAIELPHVVCHHDLFPHNVLVDGDGRVSTLLDWGHTKLAPRVSGDGPSGYRTAVERHFEPYIQLVDVTDQAALIAWGGFRLAAQAGRWRAERAGETFGVRSEPYGRAAVEVFDGDGTIVGRAVTDEANHAWVEGLRPATTYRYRVLVDGEPWGAGERFDWAPATLGRAWRPLDRRLRTHAGGSEPDPVTFLAIGDFGVGIASGTDGARQLAVARTMQRLADAFDVRFVVGLGDSIYHGPGGRQDATGAFDDDWWLTFFQPYRYLFDHLAFYPTAGNHDSSDTEASDDRQQLEDNLYLRIRFEPRQEAGRASINPGLFYRLRVSALLELVCVDTTWGAERGLHWFDEPAQRGWLERTLAGSDAVWQVPFSHHPAYCAGPNHESMPEQLDRLVPLYRRAGVRLLLHGHEHNFQHGRVDDLHYVVSGAGGKLDERAPVRFADAGTLSWAAEPHCLLVQVTPDRLIVVPYGATPPGTQPVPIARRRPDGTVTDGPITIPLH